MLQLRPTFSESWYRVATLKPRLRPGAQLSRQFYRGDRWYVVRDPAGNQFHRLSDAAYRFVGLLDGRRSVEEAWDLVGGQLADDAPTQPEVIQILSQLYAANLLETNISPDAMVLLRRHKKLVERKMQGRMMNVLFPRWGPVNPDRFLCRWMPVAEKIFSKVGAIFWLAIVGFAIAMVLPQWERIKTATSHSLDFQHNLVNIFYLYAVFVFIKVIHEFGHAFACRRFGGECHEMGVMLLVMIPTPYVDASTAWGFPSKWQRAFVGAAGMIVELFFASLCAIVWCLVNPDTSPLISQLAYNAMFIASVSTILFNANPLLRYDGYYILSDLLEIPNLSQKSKEYALGLIKRHVFRLKLPQALPPLGQRAWLLFYAITSSIYRVFIGVFIVVLVLDRVPILGVLMAIGAVITWGCVPVYKLVKYLALDPELHRKRGRAFAFSIAVAAAVVFLVAAVRFPLHVEFTGILLPDDPLNSAGVVQSGDLKAAAQGRVVAIHATDGQLVRAGQIILQLDDPQLTRDLAVADAQIAECNDKIRQARSTDEKDPKNNLDMEKDTLRYWQETRDIGLQKRADLQIKAPFAGRLVAPNLHELADTFVIPGQEIGKVAVLDKLVIKGDIDREDFPLIGDPDNVGKIEIRLAGQLARAIPAPTSGLILSPSAINELSDPALGTHAGGDIATDPRDPDGLRTQIPIFPVRLKLDNAAEQYFPGQRAYVRLTLPSRTLGWRWENRFLQLFQTAGGKWL